ncbi:early 23 Kb protein [Epinotia aporema granulovirus]|uniref:Early 23 Kb protein n=1 Tax=Epinotia aporema granulovirus TaxID=166056 RepID=K4ERT8_9BBAC|nr:early 23 Kb protein [Epinotia aporema granulovirus]AER41460.1 early 23 Kb protein [Epinotia aporema granulovirus]
MFRLGAVNTIGEAELNLDFVNTQNSIVKYCYKFIDIHQPTITRNKLVSGLDATKPISCLFDFNNSTESIPNTFVMSLFRLPHLYTDFIKQRAMTIVKVYTHNKIEYWYVLGVRKLYESVASAKIKKNPHKQRGLRQGIVPNKRKHTQRFTISVIQVQSFVRILLTGTVYKFSTGRDKQVRGVGDAGRLMSK